MFQPGLVFFIKEYIRIDRHVDAQAFVAFDRHPERGGYRVYFKRAQNVPGSSEPCVDARFLFKTANGALQFLCKLIDVHANKVDVELHVVRNFSAFTTCTDLLQAINPGTELAAYDNIHINKPRSRLAKFLRVLADAHME